MCRMYRYVYVSSLHSGAVILKLQLYDFVELGILVCYVVASVISKLLCACVWFACIHELGIQLFIYLLSL